VSGLKAECIAFQCKLMNKCFLLTLKKNWHGSILSFEKNAKTPLILKNNVTEPKARLLLITS